MVNYDKSTVYKLCCLDPTITDIYVGSTTNFRRRKNQHKTCCCNPSTRDHNKFVYTFIRNNGNWENWNMVEIEKCAVFDKQSLRARERYFIETLAASLNKQIPGRTDREYSKMYREENKAKLNEQIKVYREENKDRIRERRRVYTESNEEKINDYNKIYRKLKVTCECGSTVLRFALAQHRRTKKHLDWINREPEFIEIELNFPDIL